MYLELGETTMLLKLWENYKASPAQRNRRSFSQPGPDEQGKDSWKGPYNRNWGRGRGKKNDPKTPNLPKFKWGGRGKRAAAGKGKGKKVAPAKGKGKSAGAATIIDINPINFDADYVA